MIKLDPILAVKNVEASSRWYEKIFSFRREHGGDDFAVLVSNDEVVLCLHKWEAHQHPTMKNPAIPPGNGLLLYFRTENMHHIYENAVASGCEIAEDIHLNPNSLRQEFSFRDPDGYFLTVSAYHRYEG